MCLCGGCRQGRSDGYRVVRQCNMENNSAISANSPQNVHVLWPKNSTSVAILGKGYKCRWCFVPQKMFIAAEFMLVRNRITCCCCPNKWIVIAYMLLFYSEYTLQPSKMDNFMTRKILYYKIFLIREIRIII